MAEADWTELSGGLGGGDLDKGVAANLTPPSGGSTDIYGFSSLTDTVGAAGWYASTIASFDPMVSGGRVEAAMKRHVGAEPIGWSSFIFVGLDSASVGGTCYMLGLSDESPSKIVLRKGLLSDGIKTSVLGSDGVLAVSDDSFAVGAWVHLQLSAVEVDSGDVVLTVKKNDADVDAPLFIPVEGMRAFLNDDVAAVDDRLRVVTNSAPLIGGRAGFGFESREASRASFFDFISVARQG